MMAKKKTLEQRLTIKDMEKALKSLGEKLKKDPYTVELVYKGDYPFTVVYENKLIKKKNSYEIKKKIVYEEMLSIWQMINGKDSYEKYLKSDSIKKKYRKIIAEKLKEK